MRLHNITQSSHTWRSHHEIKGRILLVGKAQFAVVLRKPGVVLHARRVGIESGGAKVLYLLQS
jgi:hypothetical protein